MPQEIDFTPPERNQIRRGEPVPPPRVQLRNAFTVPPSLEKVASGDGQRSGTTLTPKRKGPNGWSW